MLLRGRISPSRTLTVSSAIERCTYSRPRISHPNGIRTMSSSPFISSQLQTLRKYTACDIADALLKLKVPGAGFLPDLELYAPTPGLHGGEVTIAPASTVIFTSKSGGDVTTVQPNIPEGKHWVDLTQPETFVVMAQPEGQKCAVLGGIMALRMKVLNASGVVVRGRIRDLTELRETGLPIWAISTSIVGSGAEAKPHAVQVPLDFGDAVVNPGDLVFSDPANGVAVIPQDRVSDLLNMLPRLTDADDRVKEDVSRGSLVQDAFSKHRGK